MNNSGELFDLGQVKMMKDALGDDFTDLALEFFVDCGRFASGLVAAVEAGDVSGFRELSHEAKGAAAMLGFSGISGCAGGWEQVAKDGGLPDLESVREQFPQLVEATRDKLPDLG
ncbi:MAG: Hpt domain-containing protein [Verrucomicrobiales bacterium]|nr:Hpt domain-containing protein [Verrucomicrobiota bacterium JB025]